MEPLVYLHSEPERFVAGTVGPPGQRTFYLQARTGRRINSIRVEKEQVQVLAEKITELLTEVLPSTTEEMASSWDGDLSPLDSPVEEDFRTVTMTLSWDARLGTVIVEAFSAQDDPTEALIVHLKPQQARAFARRADQVVAGGRPTCIFCGEPINPDGHLCPRANGFRRRSP